MISCKEPKQLILTGFLAIYSMMWLEDQIARSALDLQLGVQIYVQKKWISSNRQEALFNKNKTSPKAKDAGQCHSHICATADLGQENQAPQK